MALLDSIALVSISLAVVFCLRQFALYRSQRLLLPPGPPGLPILGNIFNWPWKKEWETWAKWGQQYGDVVYVSLGATSMVILNSLEAASGTLNDKGAIYSDRPQPYFMIEHIGWKDVFIIANDGPLVRTTRRLFQQELGTKSALGRFESMMQDRVRHFVRATLLEYHSPEALVRHADILFRSIILDATYGYQVQDENDELVLLIQRVINDSATYGRPGSILVDVFPWIKCLPSWMPGTGYRELGRKLHQEFTTSRDVPYAFAKSQMANGTHRPSFVATHIEGMLSAKDEEMLKNAAFIMYGAGADTSASAGLSFILLMALYPEVQTRAQAEIDSAIESSRLPTLSDRDRLPYLNAVISEVLRFAENAPIGVPHVLREDDVHNGFLIPKGAFIFCNIW